MIGAQNNGGGETAQIATETHSGSATNHLCATVYRLDGTNVLTTPLCPIVTNSPKFPRRWTALGDDASSDPDGDRNVGQLLDAANPTNILAHYEYSPFGETIVSVGGLAKANPFRFSTKYHDEESGLVYYGYRFYSPELGRWVSRDPIGEEGGLGLQVLTRNNPIRHSDYLGLWLTYAPCADAGEPDVMVGPWAPIGYVPGEALTTGSFGGTQVMSIKLRWTRPFNRKYICCCDKIEWRVGTRESYSEGLASHISPESPVCVRHAQADASTTGVFL